MVGSDLFFQHVHAVEGHIKLKLIGINLTKEQAFFCLIFWGKASFLVFAYGDKLLECNYNSPYWVYGPLACVHCNPSLLGYIMKATPLIRVCGVFYMVSKRSGGLIPGFPLSFSAARVP
jgi:hypothetical protein